VTKYDDYILEASQRFNIPTPLIRAVMAVESAFNPAAVSHAGAQGLMQLMPTTAQEMGVEEPFDPRQNILGGTRYLRVLANSFDGDLVLTLAAYNAGHQAVFRHMDIPPFAETQQYVRHVLQLYFHYKKQVKAAAPVAPTAPDGRKAP
jgi:soluble lytic murein transglycosylase-like protein